MNFKYSHIWILALVVAPLFGCDAAMDDSEYVPSITADQVIDRASLLTFVEEARRIYVAMLEDHTVEQVNAIFREEGGHWKHEDIYLFISDLESNILFHGANPALEGLNFWDMEDLNGVKYSRELVAAAKRGGGFVEYSFDNPVIDGDEVQGSPKLGYARLLSAPKLNGGSTAAIGSGIYL